MVEDSEKTKEPPEKTDDGKGSELTSEPSVDEEEGEEDSGVEDIPLPPPFYPPTPPPPPPLPPPPRNPYVSLCCDQSFFFNFEWTKMKLWQLAQLAQCLLGAVCCPSPRWPPKTGDGKAAARLALEDDGDDNKFQPAWQKKGSMTTWLLWDVMTSNYWIEINADLFESSRVWYFLIDLELLVSSRESIIFHSPRLLALTSRRCTSHCYQLPAFPSVWCPSWDGCGIHGAQLFRKPRSTKKNQVWSLGEHDLKSCSCPLMTNPATYNTLHNHQ